MAVAKHDNAIAAIGGKTWEFTKRLFTGLLIVEEILPHY